MFNVMAEKCDICGEKIRVGFLDKIEGTYIYHNKKKKVVCPNCQKKLKDKVSTLLN